MLFKLALGNIRMKFKSYLGYFFSAAFSAFVLYLFLSMFYSQNIRSMLHSTSPSDYENMMFVFAAAAVLVVLFSAFFIWYANSLFLKARKKEFATYMLLGMSKKQTVRLNFFENLILMLLAFTVGIGAGVLLNKLLVMILFKLISVSADVLFEFNLDAFWMCARIYGGVFLLISLHSLIILYKNSLLSLLTASKKAERGLRVSPLTAVIAVLSLVLLGLGYYLAAKHLVSSWLLIMLPLVLLLVCVGTFLFFTGLATFAIHWGRRNESRLFKGTRLITLSQLHFRYRGNVGTLSVIGISTSVALCAVLFCSGMFLRADEKARALHPYSLEFYDENGARQVLESTLKNHPEHRVTNRTDLRMILADAAADGEAQDWRPHIMRESDYLKTIQLRQKDLPTALENDGDCLLITYMYLAKDAPADKTIEIKTDTGPIPLRVANTYADAYVSYQNLRQTIVVRDTVYEQIDQALPNAAIRTLSIMMLDKDASSGELVAQLRAAMPTEADLSTYYEMLMSNLGMLGVLFFVGIFIGLVFVVATGSIIHFKMSVEAQEDRDKYVILQQIGVSPQQLRTAIAKQLALIFGAPFIVACFNTLAARIPFEQVVSVKLLGTYALVVASYALLYGIFYLVTLHSYMKKIRA